MAYFIMRGGITQWSKTEALKPDNLGLNPVSVIHSSMTLSKILKLFVLFEIFVILC